LVLLLAFGECPGSKKADEVILTGCTISQIERKAEMSAQGQNAKYSERADNFRFAPMNGHHQARTPCLKGVESRCDAVALGSNISVSAPFVWRCLTGSTMAPFSHPAHRTGQADFPHPAIGQNFTPSPTARRAQAGSSVRAQSARKDARVDRSRPCDAWFCA
jgi:hypothetical protein